MSNNDNETFKPFVDYAKSIGYDDVKVFFDEVIEKGTPLTRMVTMANILDRENPNRGAGIPTEDFEVIIFSHQEVMEYGRISLTVDQYSIVQSMIDEYSIFNCTEENYVEGVASYLCVRYGDRHLLTLTPDQMKEELTKRLTKFELDESKD